MTYLDILYRARENARLRGDATIYNDCDTLIRLEVERIAATSRA